MLFNKNTPYIELLCYRCKKVIQSEIPYSPQLYVELNNSVQKCTSCGLVYANCEVFKYKRRPFKLTQSDISLIELKDLEKFRDRATHYLKTSIKKNSVNLFHTKKKYSREVTDSQSSLDDFMEKK